MSDDTNTQKQADHSLDGVDNTPSQQNYQPTHVDTPSHVSAPSGQAHSGSINHVDSAQGTGQNTHFSHSQHQPPAQNHQPELASEVKHENSASNNQSTDHHLTNHASMTPQHDTTGGIAQHADSMPGSTTMHQTMPDPSPAPLSDTNHQPVQTMPMMGQVVAPATADAGAGFGGTLDNGIAPASTILSAQSPAFNTMSNTYAGAKKSHFKLIMIILGVLIVGGVATAYGVYTSFVTDPQQAFGTYVYRLSHSKTVNYDMKLETDGAQITAKGSYDITDTKQPKIDLTANYSQGAQSYGGQLKLIDMVAYFKLDQNTANQLKVPSLSNWYKSSVKDIGKDSGGIVKVDVSDCSTDPKVQSRIFDRQTLLAFPVKDVQRVGLYETVNGIKTTHFTGEIDFAKMTSFVDKLNKDLPEKCKFTYKASDYDKQRTTYEIWTGLNFDRLVLHSSNIDKPKSKIDITLETKDYDKAVSIDVPANAKDILKIDDDIPDLVDLTPATISNIFNVLAKPDDVFRTLPARLRSVSSALTKSITTNKAQPNRATTDRVPGIEAVRNRQRQIDVNAIADAIYRYQIDNGGNWPAGITTTPIGLCKTGAHCDVLLNLVVLTQSGKYLSKLPVDLSTTGQYSTGYEVSIDPLNHIVVRAPLAENGASISATR